jgi:hypothetical protein
MVSSKDLQKARQMAKRNRTSVACTRCKKAKSKCTDYRPCKKCVESRLECDETNRDPVTSHRDSPHYKPYLSRRFLDPRQSTSILHNTTPTASIHSFHGAMFKVESGLQFSPFPPPQPTPLLLPAIRTSLSPAAFIPPTVVALLSAWATPPPPILAPFHQLGSLGPLPWLQTTSLVGQFSPSTL